MVSRSKTVSNETIKTPNNLQILRKSLEIVKSKNIDGEYWECGVYLGGSLDIILSSISKKVVRGFDTFEGMPPANYDYDLKSEWDKKEPRFNEGNFAQISNFLQKKSGSNSLFLHKGFIPETFCGLEESKIAFVHLDVDLYESYVACLNFIYPRLQGNGVIVIDDYKEPSCPGCTIAVDRFFSSKPEKIKNKIIVKNG